MDRDKLFIAIAIAIVIIVAFWTTVGFVAAHFITHAW